LCFKSWHDLCISYLSKIQYLTFEENEMNQVTILTSPTCSYCHAAKDLLQRKGIAYSEVDAITDAEQAQVLLRQSGQHTVPQIFVDDQLIGGFAELAEVLRQRDSDLAKLAAQSAS
jgi:glutaredoxin 3